MKILTIVTLLEIACGISTVLGKDERWPRVSTGEYVGYGEMFTISKGNYIIFGDTSLGAQAMLTVTQKGVICNGSFFKWELAGFQACRHTEKGYERINFLGKTGNVVVADLAFEEPKGKVVMVMRMAVAPAPCEDKGKKNSANKAPK